MYINPTSQRVMIWWSLLFAAIYGFAYCVLTDLFPPPPPSLDALQVAQIYLHDNMRTRIGLVLCIFTGGFFLPWSLVIAVQMALHEKGVPVWGLLQLISGTVGAMWFALPPLFWGVAAFSVERSPAVTSLMHEQGFLTFVTPTSFFIFQVIPIIVVCFSRKDEATTAFPRWLGYFMAWYLVCAEGGMIAQLFKTGPFAWNGLFAFWIPLFGYAIYFPLICYTMLKAIRQQEQGVSRARPGALPGTATQDATVPM